MTQPLPVSPATATIDQNNFLVVNWNPPAIAGGGYTYYLNFPIYLDGTPFSPAPANPQLVNGHTPTGLEFAGSTVDSRIYQEQLVTGDYGMNMQAEPSAAGTTAGYTASPYWNSGSPLLLLFPSALQVSDVPLDNTPLELGQPVTVSLAAAYPET